MNRLSVVPFLVACLGVASFTLMDAVMKDLSLAIGVYNAMLWRMPAGILMGGTIFLGLRSRWPSAAVLRLHMLRSAVATCVALAFFWGIVRVPLAEGIAITFVAPLIALYLAALWLGEEVGSSALLASALGIAGVVVIVAGKFQLGYSREAVLGLSALFGSAVLYALNLVLQRKLAQVAAPIEVGFFQSVFSLPLLALAAPWFAVFPPWRRCLLCLQLRDWRCLRLCCCPGPMRARKRRCCCRWSTPPSYGPRCSAGSGGASPSPYGRLRALR